MIEEWLEFSSGKNNTFEDGYFYTLFMEGVTNEEIEKIFSSFPNSQQLVERMKLYLNTKPSFNYTINELENLINSDFQERKTILEQIPSFVNFLVNPKFVYLENEEQLTNLILDDIWTQEFHDFLRVLMINQERKTYELLNALYGLTYDFDYQMYLFKPLLKTNYEMNYLFQFKKHGGIYSISDDTVFFSIKTSAN